MKIVLTDSKNVSDPKTREQFELTEELGVWTYAGTIYVLKTLGSRERLKVILHEVIEYVLCAKLRLKRKYAHIVAGMIERIIV